MPKETKEESPKELTEFEKSANLMNELRKNRSETDIPLSDPYWKACEEHRKIANQK